MPSWVYFGFWGMAVLVVIFAAHAILHELHLIRLVLEACAEEGKSE